MSKVDFDDTYCDDHNDVNSKYYKIILNENNIDLNQNKTKLRLSKFQSVNFDTKNSFSNIKNNLKIQSCGVGTSPTKYSNKKTIGEGSFGIVYSIYDNENKIYKAVKQLDIELAERSNSLKSIENEIYCLEYLTCNQTIGFPKFYEIENDGRYNYLYMEYIKGESLESKLKKVGTYPEYYATYVAAAIVKNLNSLHQNGFIHRDLKPDNLMIEQNGMVKIIDFGTIKVIDKSLHKEYLDIIEKKYTSTKTHKFTMDEFRENSLGSMEDEEEDDDSHNFQLESIRASSTTFVGTEAYVSPEMLKRMHVDEACDVWALGCILYRLFTGKDAFPTDTLNPMETFNNISQAIYEKKAISNKYALDLISKILVPDKTIRLNISDIMEHPLFELIDFETLLSDTLIIFNEDEYIKDLRNNNINNEHKYSTVAKNEVILSTLCNNDDNGEFLMRECVLKKDAYLKNKRWLYLSKDILFYKDENDVSIKGTVKLEKNMTVQLKNKSKFKIINSKKTYKIYTLTESAQTWVNQINYVLSLK